MTPVSPVRCVTNNVFVLSMNKSLKCSLLVIPSCCFCLHLVRFKRILIYFFPVVFYMEGGSGLASGMLTKECCDGDLCCDSDPRCDGARVVAMMCCGGDMSCYGDLCCDDDPDGVGQCCDGDLPWWSCV